jgi:hypothetical protein
MRNPTLHAPLKCRAMSNFTNGGIQCLIINVNPALELPAVQKKSPGFGEGGGRGWGVEGGLAGGR